VDPVEARAELSQTSPPASELDSSNPQAREDSLGASNSSRRGPRRPWGTVGRVILLWWLFAAPAVYFIHKLYKPTYRAESLLLIESDQTDLFGPSLFTQEGSQDPPVYLLTQLTALRIQPVLGRTISHPSISQFQVVRQAGDPVGELRRRLEVQIIPGTHWISIALESPNAREAQEIVNELVSAYEDYLGEFSGGANRLLIKDLEGYVRKLDQEIEDTRNAILDLAGGRNAPADSLDPAKSTDTPRAAPNKTGASWPSLAAEVKAGFLTDDLRRMVERREPVWRKLEQSRFTRERSDVHIAARVPAVPPTQYFSNDGPKYMAIVSVGLLLVLVAGSLLIPIVNRSRSGARRGVSA
jgi:hypothetical protein